jgi:hypothetical protein
MTATFVCADGPYDGRIFTYRDPLPDVIVIADADLHYHEYHAHIQRRRTRPIYRWERSYRIRQDPTPGDVQPITVGTEVTRLRAENAALREELDWSRT